MASDRASRPPYVFSIGTLDEIDDYVKVLSRAFNDAASLALYPGNVTDPVGAHAYHKAVEEKYRFFSFGDAMLIIEK